MNRRAHHPARRHARPTKGPAETRSTRPVADAAGDAAEAPGAASPTRRIARRVEVTLESSSLAAIADEATGDESIVPNPATEPDSDDAVPAFVGPSSAGRSAADRRAAPEPREPRESREPEAVDAAPEPRELQEPEAVDAAPKPREPRNGHAGPPPNGAHGNDAMSAGCTAPQLRRFIKSRAYVPMHELRRRFGIEGLDDDVTGLQVERDHRVYVGLPDREGQLLGELFRAGDVGYELSLDPISPIVVGVFPMRPIARG